MLRINETLRRAIDPRAYPRNDGEREATLNLARIGLITFLWPGRWRLCGAANDA